MAAERQRSSISQKREPPHVRNQSGTCTPFLPRAELQQKVWPLCHILEQHGFEPNAKLLPKGRVEVQGVQENMEIVLRFTLDTHEKLNCTLTTTNQLLLQSRISSKKIEDWLSRCKEMIPKKMVATSTLGISIKELTHAILSLWQIE